MPLTANKMFRVNVRNDKLTATLMLHNEALTNAVSAGEIVREVKALGIIIDEMGTKAIEEFAEVLADDTIPEPIVVARGTEPEHDKNGRIEKLYKENTSDEGMPKSHYDRSIIIPVVKDQPLLRLLPPITGKDGVDVYGNHIARKLGRDAEVKLGVNVHQQGDTVYAKVSGCVGFENNKVWVESKLEIAGDVDFSIGNINFAGDIHIVRNVLDLFKVTSHSNIHVQGLIEAAEIHTAGDLICDGGITGKEKGVFQVGRNLVSKYITNAKVVVGNDIDVRIEVVNCDVNCKGILTVDQGPLVGGHVIATRGVRVKQLGSDAGIKMVIEVGVDADFRAKCLEYVGIIEQKRRKAAKVRQAVEPLLANQKHLNSEQKEKATELLYQSYEIDEEVEKMIDEIRQGLEPAPEMPEPTIEVAGRAYNGITMRFPKVETTLDTEFSGPIKFIVQKVSHTLTVVMVDMNTGNFHPMKSGASRDILWDTIDKLVNPPEESAQH